MRQSESMTDKELKRLSRSELLEMLIVQVKENENLRKQLEEAEAQLEDRSIILEESGTMAEAAMRLSGVFQAADEAAQQYLQSVREQSERCRRMEEDTRKYCAQMVLMTQRHCRTQMKEAGLLREGEEELPRLLAGEEEAL